MMRVHPGVSIIGQLCATLRDRALDRVHPLLVGAALRQWHAWLRRSPLDVWLVQAARRRRGYAVTELPSQTKRCLEYVLEAHTIPGDLARMEALRWNVLGDRHAIVTVAVHHDSTLVTEVPFELERQARGDWLIIPCVSGPSPIPSVSLTLSGRWSSHFSSEWTTLGLRVHRASSRGQLHALRKILHAFGGQIAHETVGESGPRRLAVTFPTSRCQRDGHLLLEQLCAHSTVEQVWEVD